VKGAKFTLAELLGEANVPREQQILAPRFAGGAMVISRLAPVDYHRFHFPVRRACGRAAADLGLALFGASDRVASQSPLSGGEPADGHNHRFAAVWPGGDGEIGATNVGRIRQTFIPGSNVDKGEEKGLFAFGGSCVICLFGRGRIQFDADLVGQSAVHRETYAKMGEHLGIAASGG